jgi:hypothetical protein
MMCIRLPGIGRKTSRRVGQLGQRGFVTVEMAFAALGLAVVAALSVGLFALGLTQVRCGEASAEMARQAARGDLVASQAIEDALPAEATVSSHREGSMVVVSVAMPARPWGPWLPAVTIACQASVAYEDGVS